MRTNGTVVWLPVFGIFDVCTEVLMHAIAHGGTVRESALKVDARKGKNSHVVPKTRTRVSIAPGFSVGR